ncbi:hypothetical protein M9458_050640, partial [Cirrhinus mrigala]
MSFTARNVPLPALLRVITLGLVFGCIVVMAFSYSLSQLRSLKSHPRLDASTYRLCKELGITRQPRYSHRSDRHYLSSRCLTSSSIPSIWSNRSDIRYSMLPANHRGINPSPLITVSCAPSLSDLHLRNDCELRPALALFNCRSLTNKATVLSTLLTEKDLDFLLLTETWQIPNDYFHLNLLTPSGYSNLAKPRLTSRGGSLAAVYRSNISDKTIDFHATSTFEYLVLKISGTLLMIAILLYRPPKSMSIFFTELHELLTLTRAMSSSVILLGDFNIYVNKDCAYSREL